MADSVYEQIVAAVKASIAAIIGDSGATYWYTPHKVIRWHALTEECLDASAGDSATIYVISPGEDEREQMTQGGTAGRNGGDARLTISLCQRYIPADGEQPFASQSVDRLLIQNRMAQDVEKKLNLDTTLVGSSGLARNLHVQAVDRSAETTWEEGWAIAFMHVRLQFDYVRATP